MALSDANDSITLSNYKIKYDLDYYTTDFTKNSMVDLFDICELNFNTYDYYHRFSESMVYTTLSNYKVNSSYSLNNRLVKKSDSSVRKFQPTVNSSSFKIDGESAQFLIKGFSPRPIVIQPNYKIDKAYHYNEDSTNDSIYQADINIKQNNAKSYASSIFDCDWSTKIFIWRKNKSLGFAYYDSDEFTMDSDMLCVTDPNYNYSSLLNLPTNYYSHMPYVVTCILGGAGGGGSSGVDLWKFAGFMGIADGYSRHSMYGGAGGGSGATLIMNLSFGTDTNPIGYLIEIGAGGAGGASGTEATKDTYGRGSMNAGNNGGASYIYAYSYAGKNANNQDLWSMKVVNGNYTYFAYAGGGGGGRAISSGEQPSYAEGGIAGTHSNVAQEYFQVIASFNGAQGGHGGCEQGSTSDDRYASEEGLRSAGSLDNPPASGWDIMEAVNINQSRLGYVSFNTMASYSSSKIYFPSHSNSDVGGTLISH